MVLAGAIIMRGVYCRPPPALDRSEWDAEPYQVNMAGSVRAQAQLVFLAGPYAEGVVTAARRDKLVAILHDDTQVAFALLGVAPVPVVEGGQ